MIFRYSLRTVRQSLLGIMFGPLQLTSSSSTGFEVGRGGSVDTSGFLVGSSSGLDVGFGFSSSPVEDGVLGGLSHSG